MKNTNQYLWISIVLVSLGWNTKTYSQTEIVVQEKTKNKIVIPVRVYGSASLEVATNAQLARPARTEFTPSLIGVKDINPESLNAFALDASFKIGFEKKFSLQGEDCKGVIELSGDKDPVKLTKLYMQTGNWTLGLENSNFANIATFLPAKAIQITWRKKFTNSYTFAIGVEEAKKLDIYPTTEYKKAPGNSTHLKKYPLREKSDFPALSAQVGYELGNNFGSLEISGLARPMGIHNIDTNKSIFEFGCGINIGAKLNFKPKVTILTAHLLVGNAIGSYIPDIKKMEAVEESNFYIDATTNKLNSIVSSVANVSLEHRIRPALRTTVTVGGTYILNDNPKTAAYKLGSYIKGDLMYWVTKNASVGAEVSFGTRMNVNKTFKKDNNIKAVANFSFK